MLAAVGVVGPASAAVITIDSTLVRSSIIENGTFGTSEFFETAIPTDTSRTGSLGGVASARTDFDFFEQNGQTILNFDVTHTRTGLSLADYAWSVTSPSDVSFTALADTIYDVSAFYNVTDNGPATAHTPGTQLRVALFDVTGNQALLVSNQISRSTANEQFVAGASEGDSSNSFIGSLTGNLLAGRQYRFEFSALTRTTYDLVFVTDSGSSAVGNINLTIGSVAAVPEPSSLLSFSLLSVAGLAGLGLSSRRRRAAVKRV